MNITEIQGTDGLNASRITINDNFRALRDAVNGLLGVISINGVDIMIGNDSTTIYCNQIQVNENAVIGGRFSVTDDTTIGGALTVSGANVSADGSALSVNGSAAFSGGITLGGLQGNDSERDMLTVNGNSIFNGGVRLGAGSTLTIGSTELTEHDVIELLALIRNND